MKRRRLGINVKPATDVQRKSGRDLPGILDEHVGPERPPLRQRALADFRCGGANHAQCRNFIERDVGRKAQGFEPERHGLAKRAHAAKNHGPEEIAHAALGREMGMQDHRDQEEEHAEDLRTLIETLAK